MTFNKAVGDAVEPHGFVLVESRSRDKEWRREQGDYIQVVGIQTSSSLDEATINLNVQDRSIREKIVSLAPPDPPGLLYNISQRLGLLMGPRDRWWRRTDPVDHAEVAAAIDESALPFIDRVSSPEGMRDHLEGLLRWGRWGGGTTVRLDLAILYWRLGNPGRGYELLADPPKHTREDKRWMEVVEAVRELCREAAEATPS